jgi:iron complex transport system permease protein
MQAVAATPGAAASARRYRAALVLLVLAAALLVVAVGAATVGAAGIPPGRLAAAFGLAPPDPSVLARDQLVLFSIRLPRIALAAIVGALLAASGAIMQGLFRNPLADPALVGVSSGAGFASALMIVIGDKYLAAEFGPLPFEALPVAAFIGALVTTSILYRIATRHGRTSIAIFLLGGLAIAAVGNAGIGLLVYLADDRELRDVTFWLLGSLSGATAPKALTMTFVLIGMLAVTRFIAHGLDLLVLGEAEAFHMGVEVERLKRISVVLIAACVGAAVSVSGVVGFVGIIVPHLLRLVIGPGHRLLLPASILLGAILMTCADTVARIVAAPAELPIGIVTAMIGAPFFLYLLLRQRGLVGL